MQNVWAPNYQSIPTVKYTLLPQQNIGYQNTLALLTTLYITARLQICQHRLSRSSLLRTVTSYLSKCGPYHHSCTSSYFRLQLTWAHWTFDCWKDMKSHFSASTLSMIISLSLCCTGSPENWLIYVCSLSAELTW